MKKALSFLLTLILICCMAVPAFAADNQETLVSLEIDGSLESYEITIPATITLDAAKFASGKETVIKAELTSISAIWSKYIKIYFSSQNGFYLVNTEDSSKKIGYTFDAADLLSYSPSDTTDYAGKEFPYFSSSIASLDGTVTSGNPTGISYLPYDISSKISTKYIDFVFPGSGTYTDTLTFTIELSTTNE